MAKWLRLWGKKKGSRMSGWWVVGSASEAAFFGSLFLLGIVTLTTVVSWQVFWPQSPLRIGFGFWLMVIASSSFIVIGLTAFILQISQTLASPELRSAMLDQAKREHQRRSIGEQLGSLSSLPGLARLTDSPGVKLAYRLAAHQAETGSLILSALFSGSWNTLLAILTVISLQKHLISQPNWFLTVLLVPFGCVSFFSTRWFFRLFRQLAGAGATAVEISDLPLLPGGQYELYLCQYGRVNLRKLEIALVCYEEATYQQGTDIRTERAEAARIEIQPHRVEPSRKIEDLKAEPEKPLEMDCQFSLPSDIMHSFQGQNNAITWEIVVEGESSRWPSFCRSFPVVVYPIRASQADVANLP